MTHFREVGSVGRAPNAPPARWALGFIDGCIAKPDAAMVITELRPAGRFRCYDAGLADSRNFDDQAGDSRSAAQLMIGDLAGYPDIIADMLALNIRDLFQPDMPAHIADTSENVIGVEEAGAVAEFEVQVIFEREYAAKIHARAEQESAKFHMFSDRIAGRGYDLPQPLHGLELVIAELPDAFQKRIDFIAGHRKLDLG